MTEAASSSITLQASHSWSQVFLVAVAPRLVVDGVELEAAWGERTFAVPPGDHRVEVHFPYLGGRAGKAECGVRLRPGDGVRLSYRAPIVVTSAGQLTVAGWAPAPAFAGPPVSSSGTVASGVPQPAPWAGAAAAGAPPSTGLSPLARGVQLLLVLAALIGIGVFATKLLLPADESDDVAGWADAPQVGDCFTDGALVESSDAGTPFEFNSADIKRVSCDRSDAIYSVSDRFDEVSRGDGLTAGCSPDQVRLWFDDNGFMAPEYGAYQVPRVSSADPDDPGTLLCLTYR